MMRWLVGISVRSAGMVVALGVAVLALGVMQVREMPADVLPEFRPPTVEVQTEALGLSPEEVEQLITVPIEQDLLNGVAFLDVIRSESVQGLSSIEMVFEPGTDIMEARQVVQERLTQAHALPNVSKPPAMLQPLSSTNRVMMIGLSSDELSLIEMSVLARWNIRPRLMGVPGVANVAIWGQRERQLQVQIDPERLHAQGVSVDQVVATAGNALEFSPLSFLEASTPGVGGFLDTPNQRLGVQHEGAIKSPEDLAQVPIEGRDDGAALALGDVATVAEDHQPLIGDAVFTDGPGLMLVIEKFPAANTLEVTDEVDDALDALAPGLSGIEMDPTFFRPATYVETSRENVATALLIGLGLFIVALGVLLLDWRLVLIIVAAVTVSLAAAGLVLSLRGETLNAVVVAGLVLALTLLVDDAIVDAEHIRTRLQQRRESPTNRSIAKTILDASLQVRSPILYATVVIALSVVPLFVLTGEADAFLPPVAVSYVLAVLASVLVALTLTPALSRMLLAKAPPVRREPPLVRAMSSGYDGIARKVVGRPVVAFAVLGIVLLVGAVVLPAADGPTDSLVPALEDRDVLIQWDGPAGTSLPEMSRIAERATRELRALPAVDNVGAHVGRAVMADQVVSANSSEIWVRIGDSADYDAALASIQEVVDGYPGLDRSLLTYPAERIDDILVDDTEDDITVRIYGDNLDVLRAKAEEVQKEMSEVDGVVDSRVELPAQEPTLEIEVDLEAAQEYAIKPGDVRRAAATMLSGIQVGNLFEQQKVFDVVVWGEPQLRANLDSVRNLLIDTPSGDLVRLAAVATVRVAPGLGVIEHNSVSRSIDVGANVRGRDAGAIAGDVEDRLDNITFPLEHHAELLGDWRDRDAARQRVLAVGAAVGLGILLLLQAAIGSWRLAALVLVTLVAALVGGLVAMVLVDDSISIGSLVGFFAVFGLATRHALLLIKRCQDLELNEGDPFGRELVLRASRERLVPVVTGAVATVFAISPLLFFGDRAGQEILYPMAVVIAGGVVTAALMSLVVVPALYLRFRSIPEVSLIIEQPVSTVDLTAAGREQPARVVQGT